MTAWDPHTTAAHANAVTTPDPSVLWSETPRRGTSPAMQTFLDHLLGPEDTSTQQATTAHTGSGAGHTSTNASTDASTDASTEDDSAEHGKSTLRTRRLKEER
jgi:hypothetical protein